MVNGNHPIKGIRKITKANVISKCKTGIQKTN